MARIRSFFVMMWLFSSLGLMNAQEYYTGGSWGDQGDGTYNNPVLPADYRDPDVIRVGEDYYMVSSTFWMSPGLTILHSRDLINWQYVPSAIPDIKKINRKYSWSNMNYDGCIWAPCLTYNPKTKLYYIHWGDNQLGLYVITAPKVEGPWSLPKEVTYKGEPLGPYNNDCGVMWEKDGTGYIVYNCYGSDHSYKNYLHKLSSDGAVLLDPGILIHENYDAYGMNQTGSEAYKLFKRDGYYYLWHNEVPEDGRRKLCLMRSTCIYGKHADGKDGSYDNPGKYEHGDYFIWGYRQPSQGNIVDTPDGKNWYLVTHLDKAEIDGAPICVIPMSWREGWIVPAITPEGKTGCTMDDERMWRNIPKPVSGEKVQKPLTSDDFSSSALGYQWLWNHQPRAEKWSLTERSGYLRLHAWKTLKSWTAIGQINLAGNTIYQRYYRNKESQITATIDITNMAEGQNAGLLLANYARYIAIGVHKEDGKNFIRYYENTQVGNTSSRHLAINGNQIPDGVQRVYLRSVSDFNGINRFYYSLDGQTYFAFGEKYQIEATAHRGYYVGMFTYNNEEEAGWVDVDDFNYEMKHQ